MGCINGTPVTGFVICDKGTDPASKTVVIQLYNPSQKMNFGPILKKGKP